MFFLFFNGFSFLSFVTVAAGMKEAQEKLTGDAYRQIHVGDEL